MPERRRVAARFGKGDVRIVIEDPETLKVLYDPIRFKIVSLLGDGRTAKELADEVERPLTSLYYHLNVLVDHGLVKVEEGRVTGRAVERVFQRTADEFVADGDVSTVVVGVLDGDQRLTSAVEHLRRIYKERGPTQEPPTRSVLDVTFDAGNDEVRELIGRLKEVVESCTPKDRARRKEKGRRFRLLITLAETEEQPDDDAGRRPGRR